MTDMGIAELPDCVPHSKSSLFELELHICDQNEGSCFMEEQLGRGQRQGVGVEERNEDSFGVMSPGHLGDSWVLILFRS